MGSQQSQHSNNSTCTCTCPFCQINAKLLPLFSDHAVYTHFFLDALFNGFPTNFIVSKLNQNQVAIGKLAGSRDLGNLLLAHIAAAAKTATALLKTGESPETKRAAELQIQQGNEIGGFLELLGVQGATEMFEKHNLLVISQAKALYAKEYNDYYGQWDEYYSEILMMAKEIGAAIVRRKK